MACPRPNRTLHIECPVKRWIGNIQRQIGKDCYPNVFLGCFASFRLLLEDKGEWWYTTRTYKVETDRAVVRRKPCLKRRKLFHYGFD